MRFIGVLFLALTLSGCVAPLTTPSGHPEVTVRGNHHSELMNDLVSTYMSHGYSVEQQTGFSILLTKNADDVATQLLLGSQFNVTPQRQLRLNFVAIGGSTRVIASFVVVTNPGSAFAKSTDLSTSSKAAHEIQEVLEDAARRFDGTTTASIDAEKPIHR